MSNGFPDICGLSPSPHFPSISKSIFVLKLYEFVYLWSYWYIVPESENFLTLVSFLLRKWTALVIDAVPLKFLLFMWHPVALHRDFLAFMKGVRNFELSLNRYSVFLWTPFLRSYIREDRKTVTSSSSQPGVNGIHLGVYAKESPKPEGATYRVIFTNHCVSV